jgi:hypothetical protein
MSRLLASWDWISSYQTPVLLLYLPSVSNFCRHQTVMNDTISYPERWHIENTWMLSHVFQYVIYLIANLSMKRGLGVIMKVAIQEHWVLDDWIFWGDEVCYSMLLSLLFSCKVSFPIASVKMPFVLSFVLKSPRFLMALRKRKESCYNFL